MPHWRKSDQSGVAVTRRHAFVAAWCTTDSEDRKSPAWALRFTDEVRDGEFIRD